MAAQDLLLVTDQYAKPAKYDLVCLTVSFDLLVRVPHNKWYSHLTVRVLLAKANWFSNPSPLPLIGRLLYHW